MRAPNNQIIHRLVHETLPVGLLQCNCSILGDPATGEALVVDPGDEPARVLEILNRNKLKPRAIVITHTHIDHVGGLAALQRATGAPILIHEADMPLYKGLDIQAQWLGVPTPESAAIENFVREGDSLRWGAWAARVLHTPGHTPGSISLFIEAPQGSAASGASYPDAHEPTLISGDTLFEGSIGRTDLWGGSYPQIIQSIKEKLLVLPESTVVYPGHGSPTIIGGEKESNPFLR